MPDNAHKGVVIAVASEAAEAEVASEEVIVATGREVTTEEETTIEEVETIKIEEELTIMTRTHIKEIKIPMENLIKEEAIVADIKEGADPLTKKEAITVVTVEVTEITVMIREKTAEGIAEEETLAGTEEAEISAITTRPQSLSLRSILAVAEVAVVVLMDHLLMTENHQELEMTSTLIVVKITKAAATSMNTEDTKATVIEGTTTESAFRGTEVAMTTTVQAEAAEEMETTEAVIKDTEMAADTVEVTKETVMAEDTVEDTKETKTVDIAAATEATKTAAIVEVAVIKATVMEEVTVEDIKDPTTREGTTATAADTADLRTITETSATEAETTNRTTASVPKEVAAIGAAHIEEEAATTETITIAVAIEDAET